MYHPNNFVLIKMTLWNVLTGGSEGSDLSEAGYIAGRSSSDTARYHPRAKKKKRLIKGRRRGCKSPPTTPSTSPTTFSTTDLPVSHITGEGGTLPSDTNYQVMATHAGMGEVMSLDQGLTSSEGAESNTRLEYNLPVPETRTLVDPVGL